GGLKPTKVTNNDRTFVGTKANSRKFTQPHLDNLHFLKGELPCQTETQSSSKAAVPLRFSCLKIHFLPMPQIPAGTTTPIDVLRALPLPMILPRLPRKS